MSDLRHPDLDPDYMLEPELLIRFEREAEDARRGLQTIPEQHWKAIRTWIQAEMAVARRRAVAVNDFDFGECVTILERRLVEPGSYLRDAETAQKIASIFDARSRFRVIQGGLASSDSDASLEP